MGTMNLVDRDRITIEYVHWLEDKVGWHERYPGSTMVARAMHAHPFQWVIPNDDNRGFDGLELRSEWWSENVLDLQMPEANWCSCLEMMIALAIRMEDEILYDPSKGDRTSEWFWIMMRNLGLDKVCDEMYEDYMLDGRYVDDILDNFIHRTFMPDGSGGLFPLIHPKEDQRVVEIWSQMQSYLNEHPEIM